MKNKLKKSYFRALLIFLSLSSVTICKMKDLPTRFLPYEAKR